MSGCYYCGNPVRYVYPNGVGGDSYSSCEICEWYSEDEEKSKIRYSLMGSEIIDIKKDLNTICALLHTLAFGRDVPKGLSTEMILDEVYKTKMKLVEKLESDDNDNR